MTFGEVGETTSTISHGRSDVMSGVGIFESIRLLERQRLILDTSWTTAQVATTELVSIDMLAALAAIPDNSDILSQFNYMRTGIELTIRLNTNQFYYGALMATLFPPGTGSRLDERAFQAPSVISAASAESVVKEWKYSFPFEWLPYINVTESMFPVTLAIDVLAPLTASAANAPTSITLQVWARFKDIQLSYPTAVVQIAHTTTQFTLGQALNVSKQSKVLIPAPSGSKHPNASRNSDEDSVQRVVSSLGHVTLGDLYEHLPGASSVASAFSFLVDKPDKTAEQEAIVKDHNVDMWSVDTPDVNTSLSTHRARYLDPEVRRVPMSTNMSLSQYAQIPGLLNNGTDANSPLYTFKLNGDTTGLITLMNSHSDSGTLKTALDYACVNSTQVRGSVKVMLQFFTSSFISGRFVIQYHIPAVFAASPESTNYDPTLSRVVNVKGDVTDAFQLPWLHPFSWNSYRVSPAISVTLDSVLASTDTVTVPSVYLLIWVAGGEDIQFAGPRRIQYNSEWSSEPLAVEKQALMHDLFAKKFSPIVENCTSDIDNAYATTEQIGSMSELAKKYSLMPLPSVASVPPLPAGWQQDWCSFNFDAIPTTLTPYYGAYVAFRHTMFGQMRSAFLYSSGGFRFRRYSTALEYWALEQLSTDVMQGTYTTTNDNMIRVTVPYHGLVPFQSLGYVSFGWQLVPDPDNSSSIPTIGATTPQWLAARDDIMFGWPVLPKGLQTPIVFKEPKEVINLRKTRKGKERE